MEEGTGLLVLDSLQEICHPQREPMLVPRVIFVILKICCNTAEFSGSNDVQNLQLEAVLSLAELKQGLVVCGCKCSVCFWRCVL